MSKRKKVVPQKLSKTSCSDLSWSSCDLLNNSNASDSVNLPSTSFVTDKSESFHHDKKRIHTSVSSQHILLGEIFFQLHPDTNLKWENADGLYLRYSEEDDIHCYIETNVFDPDSTEKSPITLELIILDHSVCRVIPNLFSHNYHWILQNCEQGKLAFYVATMAGKMPLSNVTNVVEYFFKTDYSDYYQPQKERKTNLEHFFKEAQTYQSNTLQLPVKNVQHEMLLPTLRSYQVDAVNWMLVREQSTNFNYKNDWMLQVYDSLSALDGKALYFNKYAGILCLCPADVTYIPTGGILADEMGLGKTVEVIACILNNPRSIDMEDNGNYLIPLLDTSEVSEPSVKGAEESGNPDFKFTPKKRKVSVQKKHKRRNSTEEVDIRDRIYEHIPRENGAIRRKVLNEWYEKILSAYSTVKSPPKIEIPFFEVRCICGELTDISENWKSEGYVQCPDCNTYQHCKCVQYKSKFQYFCPPCWTKQKKVKSCGTLIVSPTAICNQWVEEIEKHVSKGALKVLVYNGVKQGYMQPTVLSSFDIVITTYNILKTELNHAVVNESDRKLRNQEKFLKLSSPLTQIEWWRICLDEAQMVESNASNTNQMAKLIHAVHRWSVTGTPIQKSINDIYFLIEFLRVEPFCIQSLWKNCIYKPYLCGTKEPLWCLLSHIFWRSSKIDVLDKIMLPEQSVEHHMSNFNAVEKHFYARLHGEKCEQFMECVQKSGFSYNRTLDSLDKKSLSNLLLPLLKLRQACCHPQAVRGIFEHKGCMTHDQLLQYLVNKTKVESEDAVRKYVSAINGLAGICCILEEWPKAVEYYREILQFAEEHRQNIIVDSLQCIHTYNNLAEILEQNPDGISPTLRDSSLRHEAQELEKKYLQKKIGDLEQSKAGAQSLSKQVSDISKKLRSTKGWWVQLLHIISAEGHSEDLLDKISQEVSDNTHENKNNSRFFVAKVSSIVGVECTIRSWIGSLESCRAKVMTHLELLNEVSSQFLVERAVECHLRPSNFKKLQNCELCSCEMVLLDYECSLFAVSMKKRRLEYEKVLDGAHTKGSWKPHNAEVTLKCILSFARTRVNESWCFEEGAVHMKMLDVLKKEFKQLRVVWMELNHRIQAEDELVMSKLRLRLRLPGEPLPPKVKPTLSLKSEDKIENIHVIEPHEVSFQQVKLLNESNQFKSVFKKKYGTMLYLTNVGKNENSKPDPCPICKTPIENEWCVLGCGHSYCLECIQVLCKDHVRVCIKCPVCREVTNISDLCFLDLSGREESDDTTFVDVHTTKIASILRTLVKLKADDPQVKVLIFSTWEKVLDILVDSLSANNISFRRMPGYKYQQQLREFKDPKLNITALLLPIAWGSKGLNLTEATHIFFVEPVTNPADELQAIGRIHRIGQTKPTTVHHFLIKGTIEEKIYISVSNANNKWGENKITIEDLKNLFVTTNDSKIQISI